MLLLNHKYFIRQEEGPPRRKLLYSLQHGLRLDRGVIGSEVLVLFDFLLKGQVHFLNPIPETWQHLTDVIGELLVENLLQVGRPEAVRHVAVCRVAQEKLALGGDRGFYVLPAIDVFLRPVNDSHVTPAKWQEFVLQDVFGVSAVVHEIQFGQDTDCAET